MFIGKMILKGKNVACAATLRAKETTAIFLAAGARLKAAEINGKILAFSEENEAFRLPISLGKSDAVALLAERNGTLLFGSLGVSDGASARWRLLRFIEDRQGKGAPDEPKSPDANERGNCDESDREKPTIEIAKALPTADESALSAETEIAEPAAPEKVLSKEEIARERVEHGAPFPFLEDAIPKSKWAVLEEDGERFYLGIAESCDGEKVLYAIDGLRSAPALENAAFFPSPEDEEIGWFIKEV